VLFKIVDNDLIPFRLGVATRIAATPVETLHLAQQATLEIRDAIDEACSSGQRGRSRDVGVVAAVSGDHHAATAPGPDWDACDR
jgi:hypothetical protein